MQTKLLAKAEVLDLIDQKLTFPCVRKGARVSYVDLTNNILAPEKYSYKISVKCSGLGTNIKGTFYPFTVGLQGVSKLKGVPLK